MNVEQIEARLSLSKLPPRKSTLGKELLNCLRYSALRLKEKQLALREGERIVTCGGSSGSAAAPGEALWVVPSLCSSGCLPAPWLLPTTHQQLSLSVVTKMSSNTAKCPLGQNCTRRRSAEPGGKKYYHQLIFACVLMVRGTVPMAHLLPGGSHGGPSEQRGLADGSMLGIHS